jgi:hypothetical protein
MLTLVYIQTPATTNIVFGSKVRPCNLVVLFTRHSLFTSCDSVVCLHYDVWLSLCRYISREFINMEKREFIMKARANLMWWTSAVRNKRGRSHTHAYSSTYQKKIGVRPSNFATIHIHVAEKHPFEIEAKSCSSRKCRHGRLWMVTELACSLAGRNVRFGWINRWC